MDARHWRLALSILAGVCLYTAFQLYPSNVGFYAMFGLGMGIIACYNLVWRMPAPAETFWQAMSKAQMAGWIAGALMFVVALPIAYGLSKTDISPLLVFPAFLALIPFVMEVVHQRMVLQG